MAGPVLRSSILHHIQAPQAYSGAASSEVQQCLGRPGSTQWQEICLGRLGSSEIWSSRANWFQPCLDCPAGRIADCLRARQRLSERVRDSISFKEIRRLTLLSHFYEAFVSGVPGVFNVRDRVEHTRKRKIIAHAFSPGAVHAFETHMAENLRRWTRQLDRIASYPTQSTGYAKMNMMPWYDGPDQTSFDHTLLMRETGLLS